MKSESPEESKSAEETRRLGAGQVGPTSLELGDQGRSCLVPPYPVSTEVGFRVRLRTPSLGAGGGKSSKPCCLGLVAVSNPIDKTLVLKQARYSLGLIG